MSNKFEQLPQSESGVEAAFNRYEEQMKEELAELMVRVSKSGQPSDIKTALKESLIISRMFDSVISDTEGSLDIDVLQRNISEKITMLGLDPEKFSLRKLKDLAIENDKERGQ